ncbi:hypothetical protein AFL01nite_03530 [Aeromicrobium flavum]|uniref:Uncharacterized protein n=1 Tax=Aeromicrobium flavum TaxID=416568 RepID=A0A512HRG4_9ACTN|nr:hypothetical protein [Aeromicrobium flavum]GEO88026.1 hypothetical protein AFL01nite_03530 [Aeromicrobium flavum]
MRRTLLGLVTALALAAGSALVAAPAEAAQKPVTIKKITTRSIDWYGTALVKPSVKKAKKVKVLKKTLTVRQGGKVVRRNRTAVKLAPGTYRVSTRVVYRFKGKKRVATRAQTLLVRQGRCATLRDFRTLKSDPTFSPDVVGDSVAAVSAKLRTSGTGERYTPEELIALLELFKLAIDEPEFDALADQAIAEVKALQEQGVTELEDREYRACGGKITVFASFANGELMGAEDDSDLSFTVPSRVAVDRAMAALR